MSMRIRHSLEMPMISHQRGMIMSSELITLRRPDSVFNV